MIKKLFISIVPFLFLMCVYMQAEEEKAAVPSESDQVGVATVPATEAYVNEAKGYSIDLPKGWAKQEEKMGLDIFILAPPETGKPSYANASIISGALGGVVNLEGFFTGNVQNLQKVLKEYTQKDTGDLNVSGLDVRWVLYTHKINEIPMEVIQYFIVVNNRGYVITGSSIESEFSEYKETFDKMVESFKPLP